MAKRKGKEGGREEEGGRKGESRGWREGEKWRGSYITYNLSALKCRRKNRKEGRGVEGGGG